MIAIVHFIYSQSVHAPALDTGLMDNDAERYCTPKRTIKKKIRENMPLNRSCKVHGFLNLKKIFLAPCQILACYLARSAKLGKIQGGVGEVTQDSGPFLKGSSF